MKAPHGVSEVPEDIYELPTSYAQERMWVLYQLNPETSAYNIPFALRLTDRLDPEILRRSLMELVQRHESLRTTFADRNGTPVQVVSPPYSVSLPIVDLESLPIEKREKEAMAIARDEASQPFDLANGPLWRARLIRLHDREHLLVFNVHHIVFDGWSMNILLKELVELYGAFYSGKESPLKELSLQYADYAEWQKEWLETKGLQQQLSYWEEKLGGELPKLNLPTDRSRPAQMSFRGGVESFTLSRSLTRQLQELSQQEGATLFMTLLAGFQTLLHRYTGQTDLLVGAPVANRPRRELEGIIGFFVNTIVLRTELNGNEGFRELMGRIRQVSLEAFSRQDVPFEKLVEHLQPERDLSHNPLFQVLFSFQQDGLAVGESESLPMEYVRVENDTAKFDLSLNMIQNGEVLIGEFEYSTDLFDPETIQRMTGHFVRLLKKAVENPDLPLSRLPMLSETERKWLLETCNDTEVDFGEDQEGCLHHLFEKQVFRTPEQTAAVFGDQIITYQELEERSNRLAHYLQRLGVGPDVPVGIHMDRSIDLVVALLGVLKAGGAYLPLDTEAPVNRIRKILKDAQAPLCLIQEHFRSKLGQDESLVCMDSDRKMIDACSADRPKTSVTGDHLVSIYYTSGSTGTPKGVASTHEGWVNRMLWMQKQHGLLPDDAVLQKTVLTFDDAAVEFFWPLMVGGKIVLMEPGLHRDPRAILNDAIRFQVAVLQFVPSMLAMVLDEITPADRAGLSRLKVVVSSGEALRSELVQKFLDRMPGYLTNTWGATEVSIDSTIHICSEKDFDQGDIVSIGRPISNNRVYVLDQHLQPVPIGIPGDLYLGGIGLARGYLNNPQKTQEAFLEDPFVPGGRLYKTGDRGYFDSDGNLHFLGREDNQVKLRGMRVELGEIESVLCQHEKVKDAVVRVGEDDGIKYLVSYVVPAGKPGPSLVEIRQFLGDHLPKHMVPAYTILLEQFPLTSSGKVDRLSLPMPDRESREEGRELVLPRNTREELIAGIWEQLLRVDRVGVQDNFFELGGHSLLGVQVMSRIQQAFGVKVPLKVLFDRPTVAELATEVEKGQRWEQSDSLQLTPVKRQGDLPVSFSQQRLWFLDQLEPKSSVYNMTDCLRLQGKLDIEAMKRSVHELLRRHDSLRTTFREKNGKPVQVIAQELNLDIPIIDLESLSPEKRWEEGMRHCDEEARFQFDLAQGPLIRVRFIRLSKEDYILILNIHHIVYDGWSVGVLRKELLSMYEAFAQGIKPELPERVFQYADYVNWQQRVFQEERSHSSLEYWKNKLEGDLPVLTLPMKQSPSQVQSFKGDLLTRTLPKELVSRLRQFSVKEGATLFMTLLSAFKTLLQRYSGQKDLLVGIPIANRDRKEWEDVIGLFLNTLVIRSDLSGKADFRQLLHQIRTGLLEAYTHQDVPFEKIVEEIQPERSIYRNPIFDILVNHVRFNQEQPDRQTSLLDVEPIGNQIPESKFFMTFYIEESEQEVRLRLVYRKELFDKELMATMLRQFQSLLEQISKDPSQPLDAYTLITEEDRFRLPNPKAKLEKIPLKQVTDLISEWARKQPEQTAISQGGEKWTYAMLMKKSREFAASLLQSGIVPGDAVAVLGRRSFDYVAAMIGVWLARGVLVTLDADLPSARLQLLLEESRTRYLLTIPGSENVSPILEWAQNKGVKVPDLDRDEAGLVWEESFDREKYATDEPAYIFFTSGTTGKPKGVTGTHEGLSHFLLWQRETFGIDSGDCSAQLTNSSFDVFLRDVFMPLISGARVCIPDHHRDWSAEEIIPWMEEEGVTFLHTVPSIAESWVHSPGAKEITTLCWVFFAGEPLSESLVRRWRNVFGRRVRLANLYGPTETTLAKCCYLVPENPPQGMMPVGKPLPQSQALVVNSQGQLCGVGELGEIVIRTPYQTLGYIQGDQGGFTENPFLSGEQIYRTGDQGRYQSDGTLEILGRIDDQIKIRGVRVNLNEVGAVLSRHSHVRSCTVMDWKGDSGTLLVAYVIPSQGEPVTESDLRAYMRNHLPEAMVPGVFLFLDQIPLTANGKVDRRRLPDPSAVWTDKTIVPPRTPLEKQIAKVWMEVLSISSVGVEDSFFELGGHSLLATQIVARLKSQYKIQLQLRHLFEFPTIAGLAEVVQQIRKSDQSGISRIKRLSRDEHRMDLS
ncbi:amino acid adenylation domain-containing protein [Kroppenstedtia pulmonis]|uniref:Amino acid adenylation domain-containing protein n=1 Tax=Kroppenstedtia pulmonis TaxID=1380685 RepID=A0A7D4BW11_9BACL|nr:non-ribosomal peptide synthetase [Kroppenstedtia pulmonis]QKG84493.1 amino acid adenylation domain-containing protein [Kroppenstedtia pulmonis]